jgi:hypothetical protein
MRSKFLILFVLALFLGCKSTPQQASPNEGLLTGEDSSNVKVMIRKIDEGEILWSSGYKLGTTAPIETGQHSVSIMCEFTFPWGTKLLPGTLDIDVKAGTTYQVSGKPSSDGEKCLVSANTLKM